MVGAFRVLSMPQMHNPRERSGRDWRCGDLVPHSKGPPCDAYRLECGKLMNRKRYQVT